MNAAPPATPDLHAILPAPLGDLADRWLAEHGAALGQLSPPMVTGLRRLLALSPYAADCLLRYPDAFQELVVEDRLARPAAPGELAALLGQFAALELADEEFGRRLRVFRHREMVRILWRDLVAGAAAEEILADLSALADAAINAALAWAERSLAERHGVPRLEEGGTCGFGIVAMGKLGGHELNFSSDVDLVFLYTGAGETTGPRVLSNEEYFRVLAQRIIDLLSRKTADGFVYRVDARLRPFGSAGPLAVSLPAFEAYLLRHGRDWERYAWIKARVVNEWSDDEGLCQDVLRPFVYRRYLDYGVFASLRDMKALIEAEVQRKEYRGNLKLGPGGIREIEFIAQALQLVRGGTVAELRCRELLPALERLARHGCLPAERARELADAYRFLRQAENRIQAQHDRQTHDLPQDPEDRLRLATAMGSASWEAFIENLDGWRRLVQARFRDVVFRGAGETVPDAVAGAGGGSAAFVGIWRLASSPEPDAEAGHGLLAAAGFPEAAAGWEALRRLQEGPTLRRLGEAGRQRLDVLMPAVLADCVAQPDPVRALDGMVLIIESIGRRSAYFALLNENPAARERLVRLCGLSGFLSRQVGAHPLLLDELLDPRVFEGAPDRAELKSDLEARLAQVPAGDLEARLDALRNFQQAGLFRVAVADLAERLPLMKVSDRLTDIAELVLEAAITIAWEELARRHGAPRCADGQGGTRPVHFGIVGYGKLGGLELGYGSDLDLVFLHDSEGDAEAERTDGALPLENAVFFSRLTQRIISILTLHTTTGKLYEVDLRLRPSGRSGLLVCSLAAFDRYQREDAWTWEHQALLRSRAAAGDPVIREAFEKLRVHALVNYVRRDNLRQEVADMRRRMQAELARGTDELMDVKQDPGGITDIEFLVQYLVLAEARRFPDLVRWSDNIRQLEALADHGLLPRADAEALADTYRAYRQRLHHLNLAGAPGLVPRGQVAIQAVTVRALWERIFGPGPDPAAVPVAPVPPAGGSPDPL